MGIMADLLSLLVVILVAIPSSRSHALPSSSSPFDAALATLQNQIAYRFHAPDLLRRAMTHASYSRENGRALAVLGLAASQSAAALRALAADHDASASASAVSRRARDASGEAACVAAAARVGIPSIVRVAAGTKPTAPLVVCGALRALIGAVAVDANSTHAAEEVFWKLHVLTAASAKAAM
uniref:RNase III domain-containing protein n=1 Tax=Oryza meridionalis TaxID=40149 RepID=A0A0E0D9P8_9ORYZ